MAASDYWLCDICGRKTFYNVNLDYDALDEKCRYHDGQLLPRGAGDMRAICYKCAKKYELIVRNKTSMKVYLFKEDKKD